MRYLTLTSVVCKQGKLAHAQKSDQQIDKTLVDIVGLRFLPDEPIGRSTPKLAPQNTIFVTFLADYIGKFGLSCKYCDDK